MRMIQIKEKGFTILELIVAFTIMGLILLIMGSGLRLGIKAWERGEKIVDESQRIRVLWERLSQEIRSAYPYQIYEGRVKKIGFEGSSDSLSFVTSAIGMDGGRGFRWVSYYIKNNALMVKEKRLPDKELAESKGKEIVLEKGIRDIKFEFYEKKEKSWESTWDGKEKGRLPEIVKVTITLKTDIHFLKGLPTRYEESKTSFPPLLISLPVAYNPSDDS